MKIRNNMRITALVLALVMLLPLISIPVFAGEETDAPKAPLFSENFDGKTIDDVAAGKASTAIITTAAGKTAGDDALQLSVAGKGLADYYLWQNNNNKWPITEATITDGKISGKTDKGDVVEAPIPADDSDESKSCTVGDVSYKIVTGVYADCKGGAGNIATPTKFKNVAVTVADHSVITVEMDIYLPTGLKNTSGISGRMQGKKVSDGKTQNIELFEIKANGTTATIAAHENSSISKGEAASVALGAWVNLMFEVDFTNKHVSVLVNEKFAFRTANLNKAWADVSEVNADSLQVQVDRGGAPSTNAEYVQFDNISVIDGLSGITYNPNAIKPVVIDFENLEAGAAASGFNNLGGIANTIISDEYGSKAWKIDFEQTGDYNKQNEATDVNIDKNPKMGNPAVNYADHGSIVIEYDILIDRDATGRTQCQITPLDALKNGVAASGITWNDLFVIDFFGAQAKLTTEGNIDFGSDAYMMKGVWNTITLVLDLVTGMRDFYINGVQVAEDIQLYKGSDALTNLTVGANTLIIGGKINNKFENTKGTIYVDNFKFDLGTAPTVEPDTAEIETFEKYSYLIGKGSVGLSVPKLAILETFADTDNVVTKIPMAASKTEGLALLREDGRKVISYNVEIVGYSEEDETVPTMITVPDGPNGSEDFDLKYDEETGLYYAYFIHPDTGEEIILNDSYFDPNEFWATDRYFVVPAATAELAIGAGGQIGTAFKVPHGVFSYKDTDEVVLSADYFIEAGSKGVIEAQFESYKYDVLEEVPGEVEGEFVTNATTYDGSWIQLYSFDLATGQFEGLEEYMTIGAWNNVKVIMNLVTGVYEIYLNDALVKTEFVDYEHLTIGLDAYTSFSAAKIQRTTSLDGEIAGNLYVDNVGVSATIPADSQYGDGYLSDEAYLNNLSKMLVTVKDPSFRFENYNGIRFATKIDPEFAAGIFANLGEDALVGMGTLIAPLDYVKAAGAFTKEALSAIEADTEAKYLDIPFAEFFDGAKGVSFGEDELVFTASIVNIKEANLMRDFAAIGYVMFKLPDGSTRTYYAKSFAVSNVVYEAEDTLAKTEVFDWTEEEYAILKNFEAVDVENLIDIAPAYGTSRNPEFLFGPEGELSITDRGFYTAMGIAGWKLTVTGPEGFKLYYNGEFIDSVDGVVVIESVVGDFDNPFVMGFTQAGDYTYVAVAPIGSQENPAVIESIEAPITAAAPEGASYWYEWTSTLDGFLTVTTENANAWIYARTMNVYPDAIEGAGVVKVPVTIGETVTIEVATLDRTPAEVAFTLATVAGTMITSPVISAEIPAGEIAVLTGPANMLAGKVFNLANNGTTFVWVNSEWVFADGDFAVELAANDFGTVSIFVKNNGEEAITIEATLSLPAAGTIDEPKAIGLGAGAVAVAPDGYLMWTAEAAGEFTFAVTSMENWVFNITNQNTSVQTDMVLAGDEIPATTVTVAAGDVLVIMIGALDMVAADVEYVAEFAPAEAEA